MTRYMNNMCICMNFNIQAENIADTTKEDAR